MVRRVLGLTSGRVAVSVIAAIVLLAIIGPHIAPYDPLVHFKETLTGPSRAHWFGTDYLGRDVLSRLLSGARISVLGALEVALIALAVGAIPGILSVYLGRVFEWVSLRLVDTLIALPFLVFAVAVTALMGNGITQAMFTVGILASPMFYRVTRAATLAVAHSQYVEAAILSGASVGWVIRKHVWLKVLPSIAVTAANAAGTGFIVVSSLTFLGIGVQPPAPSWGGILASDLNYLTFQPYAPLFAIVPILATVWSFHMLADAIRDVSGQSGRRLVNQGLEGEESSSRDSVVEHDVNRAVAEANLVVGPVPVERSAVAVAESSATVVAEVQGLSIGSSRAPTGLVRDVSFRLPRGRVVGIVGESGSGKTMTCRAVLGLLPDGLSITQGDIRVLGRNVRTLPPKEWAELRGASVAAVFQDPASYLNPSIQVGRQIAEVLQVRRRLSRKHAKQGAVSLLRDVRLREPELVYTQYPHQLSGGMLQRVLIASAVALNPEILVADEVTTALDATVQAEVLDLLVDLKERTGLSLIVVSHDLAVVSQLCDEVLVLRNGEVVEQGPTEEILKSPSHDYTRLLVAQHNLYGLERFLKRPQTAEDGNVLAEAVPDYVLDRVADESKESALGVPS